MKTRIAALPLLLLFAASTALAADAAPSGRKTLVLGPDRSVTVEMAAADRGSFDGFMAALQGNLALAGLDTVALGKPPITLSRRGVPGVMPADLRNAPMPTEKKKPAGASLADVRDIVNRMALSVADDVDIGRVRITGKGAGETLDMAVAGAPQARLLYAGGGSRTALDAWLASLSDPLAHIRRDGAPGLQGEGKR